MSPLPVLQLCVRDSFMPIISFAPQCLVNVKEAQCKASPIDLCNFLDRVDPKSGFKAIR
jgi:hypothetical protein